MAAAFRGEAGTLDFVSGTLGPKLPRETTPPRTETPGIAEVPFVPEPPGPRASVVPLSAAGLDPGPGPLTPAPAPGPATPVPGPEPRAIPLPPPAPPRPGCPWPVGDIASEPGAPFTGAPTASPGLVEMTTASAFIVPPLPVAFDSAAADIGTGCSARRLNSEAELLATSTLPRAGIAGAGGGGSVRRLSVSALVIAETGVGISSGTVPVANCKSGFAVGAANLAILESLWATGTGTVGASTGSEGLGAADNDRRFAVGPLMRGKKSLGSSTTDGRTVGAREIRITWVGWKASLPPGLPEPPDLAPLVSSICGSSVAW